MVFVVFFSAKHFEKKIFKKLIVRFEISSKNHIFKYKYFRGNKLGITSKLKKKKVPRDFFEKKILKKKLGLNTTMLRKYRMHMSI